MLLLCCLPLVLVAQQNHISFSQLDIAKGLSHNQVNTMYRDANGFVWIGTMSGLNRFDGYECKVYRHNAADTNSLTDNYIHRIYPFLYNQMLVINRGAANVYNPVTEKMYRNPEALLRAAGLPDTIPEKVLKDAAGNLWFSFRQRGLWQIQTSGKVDRYDASSKASVKIASDNISDFCAAADGSIWILHSNGIVEKLDTRKNAITYAGKELQAFLAGPSSIIFAGSNGNIWLAKSNESSGVYQLNPATHAVVWYSRQSPGRQLSADIITGITQDKKGDIWIATDHGGINIINALTGNVSLLTSNADDARSISQNSTVSLYNDEQGIIWVGTFKKGVNYYNENLSAFPLLKHLAGMPQSLPYDDVNRFAEDANGNLWIGTNGGGLLYYNRSNNTYKQYTAANGALGSNVIVALCIDKQQKLWIGSYFGGLDCFDGQRFIHYKNIPGDTNSLADNRVMEIMEDDANNLWIGTLSAGLLLFDRTTQRFTSYHTNKPNEHSTGYISKLLQDKAGNLWIGTSNGIDIRLKKGGFKHLENKTTDSGSLSNNNVVSMLCDSKGRIWVGTREGLNLYDAATNSFQRFDKKDGLPDNAILNMLEDRQQHIWISTPNGLSQIKVSSGSDRRVVLLCHNYNELNNLQGREFNEKAAFATSKGELLFGGAAGFNLFQPERLSLAKQQSAMVITGLEIFNKEVKVGEELDGRVLLEKAIAKTPAIRLKYNQNLLSLSFTATDFARTEKDLYAYKLDGFSKDWVVTDLGQRKATFTNLDPGKYVFKVKALDNQGRPYGNEASLQIEILPPFWQTPLAYILYAVSLAAVLWLGRKAVLRRARMRFAIERERQEARRMHELDLMKIRFITNVSHEFRTPLSLIMAPADKLMKAAANAGQQQQVQMIQRNARRLLNLVNQLLDFRKLEVQEFQYHPAEADIVQFSRDIAYSFTDIAERKQISFSFNASIPKCVMQFDADKLEKILFNLLSNAYKFTPDGGRVSLSLELLQTNLGSLEAGHICQIKVTDTGIGMPEERQEKIFERFFQNEMPGNILNQGSGIGLAIVKEFVKLHGGTVAVKSKPEEGSCFTVNLPVVRSNDVAEPTLPETPQEVEQPEPLLELAKTDGRSKSRQPLVLIVEDSEDLRFYLKENLGLHFRVAEAANGKEGWQQAQTLQPDLVVSDVMMPLMSGLELAKKIKTDARTHTIPIILLTARTAEEQQLEGLDTGANDYISKPFSFEILLSRIRNQLAQQKASKKPVKQITVASTDVQLESEDEKYMQKALQLVEQNMANADFSVEDLSRELLMSRVGLYKKMVALTGKTPIEFIKDIRMAKAKQLLHKTNMTIAEVAYETGFNDPKYFGKAFKKEFGVLPTTYRQELEEG